MSKKDDVLLDNAIVSAKYQHGDNHVKYDEFYAADGEVTVPDKADHKKYGVTLRTNVCFSDMTGTMAKKNADGKLPNRIYYELELPAKGTKAIPKLTKDECEAWMTILKDNDILPEYVDVAAFMKTFAIVLKVHKDTRVSWVYIILSCVRYMREEPGFVRAMNYLVNEKKADFFLAFAFASRACVTYTVHHILLDKYSRSYAEGAGDHDVNKFSFNPLVAIAIKRIFNDPEKYDQQKISNMSRWQCYNRIDDMMKKIILEFEGKINKSVPAGMVVDEGLTKIVQEEG